MHILDFSPIRYFGRYCFNGPNIFRPVKIKQGGK